jgi:NTP pyrophosphatase (non-canonical NTP hydrolase)
MEIKEMQEIVDKWVNKYTVGYWTPANQMLRLMEEVGELSREINHQFGQKPRKSTDNIKDMGYELADVLFTVVCIANGLEIDLEDAFKHVMEKYDFRDRDRYVKK